jgi:hypothetical protein
MAIQEEEEKEEVNRQGNLIRVIHVRALLFPKKRKNIFKEVP